LALHRLTWLVPGALLHQVRVRRQGCHPQDR
jgi:hypothetical protein